MQVGELIATLGLDPSEYEKGLEDAERRGDKATSAISTAFKGIAIGGVAVAATAIAGVGVAAFNLSSDVNNATNKIQTDLGVTADEAQALGKVATDVFANNFAESIGEAGDAVSLVKQQLGTLVDDADLQGITENAFRLKDAFGIEVADSVSTVRTLMENFGLTSQEAFDFIAKGQQKGLNRSGDFLDTINEYATQFSNGKATASQFFSLLDTGLQGGVLGTDKAADAFKEFSLRFMDSSATSDEALATIFGNFTNNADAIEDTSDKVKKLQKELAKLQNAKVQDPKAIADVTEELGLQQGKLAALNAENGKFNEGLVHFEGGIGAFKKAVMDGSITTADAFSMINQAIASAETPTQQMRLGTALLGTQFEDLGASGAAALSLVGTSMEDLSGATSSLDAQYNNFPALFEGFKRQALVALQPVGDELLKIANEVMPYVTAAFSWLKDALPPIIEGARTIIANLAAFLGPLFAALATTITTVWQSIQRALGDTSVDFTAAQDVITRVVKAIGSVVETGMDAVTDFWRDNGDDIKTFSKETWKDIQDIVASAVALYQETIVPVYEGVAQFLKDHKEEIVAILKGAWEIIQGVINVAVGLIGGTIKTALALIRGDWAGAWNEVKSAAAKVWTGIQQIINGAATQLQTALGLVFWGIVNTARTAFTDLKNNVIYPLWDNIKRDITNLITEAKNSVTGIWDDIVNTSRNKINEAIQYIEGMPQRWRDAGNAMVQSLYDATIGKLNELINEARNKFQELTNLLPGSEPKDPTSPLRNLAHRGAALVENFQAGIDSASLSLAPQIGNLTGQMSPVAANSSYSTANNINITVNGGDRSGIESVVRKAVNDALRQQGQTAYNHRRTR